MYSVYQHWDPLKVCVVGKSYPPEFYAFMQNSKLRNLFEKIAIETEEDYLYLESTLKKLNVDVVRPDVPNVQVDEYLTKSNRIPGPVSMTPRDQLIMIGNTFFVFPFDNISKKASGRISTEQQLLDKAHYDLIKGSDWPDFGPFETLPKWVQDECFNIVENLKNNLVPTGATPDLAPKTALFNWWQPIIDKVKEQGNTVINNQYHHILNKIPTNGITRVGRDLYIGSKSGQVDRDLKFLCDKFFNDYRCHYVTTDGHIDGCFTPVVPGLIVSIRDMETYKDTFPGWEVVYLDGESWDKVTPFLDLKRKNQGKWWIKGHEHNDELIDYVETWLQDWVGYCEETVFDVNILVVNEKNIIVNGYNKIAFDAFERYGITPHICPIRHRYFWDGGIHCVTLDLHRDGTMQNYFPERG